jgi:hypothetical protein
LLFETKPKVTLRVSPESSLPFMKGKNRSVDSKQEDMLSISNTSLLVTLGFGQGKNFSIFAVTRIL